MKKLLVILFLAVFLISGCAKQDLAEGECMTIEDCEGLMHIECVGEWHCVDNTCDYECTEEVVEEPAVETETAEEEPEQFIVEPVVVETVETEEPEPVEPVPSYTQAQLDKYAIKDLFPLDISDPRQYLALDDIQVKRISYDKGELRSMTFTVRNPTKEEMDIEVRALMFGFTDQGKPAKIEKEYNIIKIPPGFKYQKKFPLTVYFEGIEEMKTIELYLKEKFRDPSDINAKVIKKFVPVDEFETMEITW